MFEAEPARKVGCFAKHDYYCRLFFGPVDELRLVLYSRRIPAALPARFPACIPSTSFRILLFRN